MIALIASLVGFGSSVYGPSDCPACCGRSAVAQRTDLSRGRVDVRQEAAMSLLRAYPFGNAGNVLMSRNSPRSGAQR
jgi:hypothetical protein